MKKFLILPGILSLLAISFFSQIWEQSVSKRAGEDIVISWEYPNESPIDGFSVYRQTGIASTPTKVASLGPMERTVTLAMPTGTTKQYRFRVVAVKGTSISPAGREVVVNRIN
jgi:hypothetical protein